MCVFVPPPPPLRPEVPKAPGAWRQDSILTTATPVSHHNIGNRKPAPRTIPPPPDFVCSLRLPVSIYVRKERVCVYVPRCVQSLPRLYSRETIEYCIVLKVASWSTPRH